MDEITVYFKLNVSYFLENSKKSDHGEIKLIGRPDLQHCHSI